MRRYTVLCLFAGLLLVATAQMSRSDVYYDDAKAIEGIYDRIGKSLNDLDIPALVSEFTDDGTASVWNKDTELLGKAQTTGVLMAWSAQRQKNEFHPQPVRIFLDDKVAWATFSWTWGEPWTGDAIGVLQKEAAGWKVRSIDFYSVRLERPIDYFDPREPVKRMQTALTIIQMATGALAKGDIAAMTAGAHSGFNFVDEAGTIHLGKEGLAAMAQDPMVQTAQVDKMTLYVSNQSGRAIARKAADGKNLCILLRVEDGTLKIHTVSRLPLDVLPVSSRDRLATTWGILRRNSR